MDDGAFELILLRMPKTPLDLQNLIVAMTRQQYDYPGVIFRHVSNVTVTTEEDHSVVARRGVRPQRAARGDPQPAAGDSAHAVNFCQRQSPSIESFAALRAEYILSRTCRYKI